MKLYNINRIRLFDILAKYNFDLQHAGQCFASAFLSDEQAANIEKDFPNCIFLAY